jgi:MFS family permease
LGSFDSLRYRNYRLLWMGAGLSNIGTWMQSVALSWYVFLLTHSPFWVSFVTFVNFVPTVLSPIGGVFTDRLDRKRILLVTQTLMMVDAAVLAVLAAVGRASLFAVLALTFGQGLAFALNGPTWQAFIPSLVPPEAMVNAIALNSAQFSLARVIGPALGGALIVSAGAGVVFGINAGSFLAVLVALALVRLPRHEPSLDRPRVLDELAGGLRYTWRERRIRTMIATVAVASFFGAPITALLPVYAADVFGRGAGGFGVLAAAAGAGALVGALALGRMGSRVSPGEVAWSMVGMGVALVLFAAVRVYVAGLVMLLAYGAAYLFSVSGTNGDIQLHVKDALRGRVLSLFMLAFGASYPLGSLIAGIAAESWGPRATTFVGGVVCTGWGLGLARWWYRTPPAEAPTEPD